MALVEQHLGGDVLWGAAERVRTSARLHDLREAEIGELRVPVRAEQDVLRLEVRVGQAHGVVQETQRPHRLLRYGLDVLQPEASEAVLLEEVVERRAARLEDEAEVLAVGEGLVHDGAPRVLTLRVGLLDVAQDIRLDLRILHVPLDVTDHLHRDLAPGIANVLRQEDAAKGAVTEEPQRLVPRVQDHAALPREVHDLPSVGPSALLPSLLALLLGARG
mmetsp:Transcript_3911/g.11337  ORF Transcript_3911/g.11337 Transcript_3911/m.11337 type:complete len:219 (+) Transcript_3911:678-1334(+)